MQSWKSVSRFLAVSNRKRTELKIWRSIVFKHLFAGRLKGPTRNDGRLCSYGGIKGSNRNDGQLCNHGGVKESLCTPRTIMVKFAILALAVGKRTGPLVGVRYIYLRKNVEIWWGVKRCIFDICTEGFNIKPEILYCSLFRILRK